MITYETIAIVLYSVGGLLALAGPALAAYRRAGFIQRRKIDSAYEPDAVREAWWGIWEFGLVGLGIAITTAVSITLVPGYF